MRARRSGAIVNLSSIGARATPPGSGYYSATKAALEGLSGSLAKEVGPLGISVTVVEPGSFRTDFAGRSLTQSPSAIADYADTAGPRRKENDRTDGTQSGDPDRAARVIIEAVEAAKTPTFLLLGPDALTGYEQTTIAVQAQVEAWRDRSASTDLGAGGAK
jgi:NAD(P)-dependent dehydrogenase (short-subunit alcohol dehydrogenase family)